jgi:hemin uptake protein HemP
MTHDTELPMLDPRSHGTPSRQGDAVIDDSPSERIRLPRVDSARLLAGGRELIIDHTGAEYRLRLTRNGKLILTK